MSTITSTVVKFPSQQEIIDYINGHPIKKYGMDKNMYIPDSNTVIAKCFADKQMQRNEIEVNVRKAIMDNGNAQQQKMHKLLNAVHDLKPSALANDLKNSVPEPELLTATVQIYSSVLNDLLDGAIYIPPKDEKDIDGVWTRHVTQISKQ